MDHESDVLKMTPASIVDDVLPFTQLQIAYEKQKDSVFFGKFPPEIRNRIYTYLLVVEREIKVDIDNEYAPEKQEKIGYAGPYIGNDAELDATFSRTCRLTVYETYPILYGENVFAFSDWGQTRCFEVTGKPSHVVQ